MSVIGIDTSNYTTSIAYYDGVDGENCSKLLPVKQGELGLRQSDAVFSHTKSPPQRMQRASVAYFADSMPQDFICRRFRCNCPEKRK